MRIRNRAAKAFGFLSLVVLAGCGGPGSAAATEPSTSPADDVTDELKRPRFDHVFVVMMENHDASQIYGAAAAPYINSLMQQYAYSTNFNDVLPIKEMSEPHYIWLEAGTNVFPDKKFSGIFGDFSPSAWHSTRSTAHLSTLLDTAKSSWMSYQEMVSPAENGACPIDADDKYAPKHDPFVFFQDVSGSPPSKKNTRCAAHHRNTSQLGVDLASDSVAHYVLVTPNLCHDMHDDCGGGAIANGDAWLRDHVPAMIDYARAHRGLVLIVWDEGDSTTKQPFVLVANSLKQKGYASDVALSMSSLTKSLQEIFRVSPAQGIPFLGHAADDGVNDLGDFFKDGSFP